MPPRDDRPEYVVELAVSGVAIVSLRAESAQEACEKAIGCVRPADVHELTDEVEATTVAGPFERLRSRRRRRRRSPETASAASPGDGQA